VSRGVLRLEENPRPHGVEKMETKEKLYRFYVGPGKSYRVIYQIRDEILLVLVMKLGDGKEVYRRVKGNCRPASTHAADRMPALRAGSPLHGLQYDL